MKPFFALDVTISSEHTPYHTHEYNEFFLCIEGEGVQATDQRKFHTKPGELFFFPEGQIHGASTNDGKPNAGLVLNFADTWISTEADSDAEAIMRFLKSCALANNNVIKLEDHIYSQAKSIMQMLLDAQSRQEAGVLVAMKSYLLLLLATILGDKSVLPHVELKSGDTDSRLHHIIYYIENQFHEKITIEQAAKMACMSRSHFHSVFKQDTGYTFVEYLSKVRIERAQTFLTDSDLPISSVALACGFPTLSRFYDAFSKITGVSPKKYRQSNA